MSNKPTKNGKMPSSSKKILDDLSMFGESSILDVDPGIVKHVESQGMTLRWINATNFKKAGGFSGRGWAPLKIADVPKAIIDGSSLSFGQTAEGYIMRNDLMLAVRSKEKTEHHKRQLRARAALAAGKQKSTADGIREQLGSYGKVIEGYEDNGEE